MLDDKGSRHQVGGQGTQHRYDRYKRVSQYVLCEYLRSSKPLRPGGSYEELARHVKHVGAYKPRDVGERSQAQGQCWKDDVLRLSPEGGRQNSPPDGEKIYERRSDDEARDRYQRRGDQHGGNVVNASRKQRGDHSDDGSHEKRQH